MTAEEFKPLLATVQATINRKFTAEQNRIWFKALEDLPVECVDAAVKRWVLQCEDHWPVPATIRRLAVEAQQGQLLPSDEAFEAVRRAVRSFGFYRKADGMKSLDNLTRRALERCGGWEWACELREDNRQAFCAQFRRAYESVQRQAEQSRVLPESIRPAITNGKPQKKLRDSEPTQLGVILGKLGAPQ